MLYQNIPKCNRCNSRMLAEPEKNRLWCQVCGYVRTDSEALRYLKIYEGSLEEDSQFPPGFRPPRTRHGLDTEMEMLLDEAWDALKSGKKREARLLAHRVVSRNHRIVEGYYILYLASTQVMERARHLVSILALNPNHNRAKEELQKLVPVVGKDIKPSFNTIFDHRAFVDEEVEAKGKLEQCPMCGGETLYVSDDHVKCLACGFSPDAGKDTGRPLTGAPIKTGKPAGFHNLEEALMQRQYGSGKQWIVAKRVLACQNCGAQLTLSGNMMVDQCTFCDSQHVLFQDALESFQEPDAILPARLNQQEAVQTNLQELPSHLQRDAYRYESVGVFLSYWQFKVPVWNVSGSRHDFVLIPGSLEPSPKILEDILPFDLNNLHPYDQRYLAHWSAQLYTQDAVQASLQVTNQDPETLEYRFVLLPVWMTTIHLRGGGYYHSVINAQTGEVVITGRVDSKSDYQSKRDRLIQQQGSAPLSQLSNRGSVIRPIAPRDTGD